MKTSDTTKAKTKTDTKVQVSRGRKPFAQTSVSEFTKATKQINFKVMSKNDAYNEYLSWAEANGSPTVSFASFNKFFEGFNSSGSGNTGIKPLTKTNLSLNDQFTLLEQYTGLVVDGILKSLYIKGEPGIGKTETVKRVLSKLDANVAYYSGGVKGAYELAKILYENRSGKVIVFDDFDSCFGSRAQVDLLKIALQDKDVRTITYEDATKRNRRDKIVNTFDFTSSVIFISNRSRLDPAIKSRCKIINFETSKSEILEYIKSKFDTFLPNIPYEIKDEVYTFLKKNINGIQKCEFRYFKFCVADRLLDMRTGNETGRWKKIILSQGL